MKTYLLPASGRFYKANLHAHSTFSDGKLTPAELKTLYQSRGYSIIAYTDHDLMFHHRELNDEKFLALSGFELYANEALADPDAPYTDKRVCHLCFVALTPEVEHQVCFHRTRFVEHNIPLRHLAAYDPAQPDFERAYTPACINEMIRLGREAGFFVTYNHPTWSLEYGNDYLQYQGMHAMEIFNGGASAAGYDDYNPRVYDDMLRHGQRIYCIAADDNHNNQPPDSPYSDSFRGWTMIKAERLEHNAIGQALENGHFYASQGPEITDLWLEEGCVHLTTPAAVSVRYNTGRRVAHVQYNDRGEDPLHAVFPVEKADGYFRLTVTDGHGLHACTNAYFTDTLPG